MFLVFCTPRRGLPAPAPLPRLIRALAHALLLVIGLGVGLAPAWSTPTSALRFKRLGALDSDELSILALLQDRQGFVWIGTLSGGLYRYNGYQAVRYTSGPQGASLPHDRVSTLFEDAKGTIWAGTQNGLARFNPATNNFSHFAPPAGPASQRIVKAIIGDGKDGMWLATWGGLQHFAPATGTFTLYQHDDKRPDSLASNDVNAIALDERGGVWAATWPGGLDYLAPGSTRFRHHRLDSVARPDPKLNIVRTLHYAPDRTLWVGTESGIVTLGGGRDWEARRRIDSPPSRINYLYGDRNGTVWAGTLAAGLLRWDKGWDQPQAGPQAGPDAMPGAIPGVIHYVHRANDSHSLPSDDIRTVMHDRSGMLWIGSITDGLSLVNLNSQGFQRFIPFDVEANNLRPNNSLRALAGDGSGRLWLGTHSGVSLFDPSSGAVQQSWRAAPGRPGALSNDIVYSLYQQPKGPLWIGTAAGLNRLDGKDAPLKVLSFGSAANDFINTIAPGAGAMLWLGTGQQVIRYDTVKGDWTSFAADPAVAGSRSVNSTTTILEDRLGRVWMGSEWGGGGLDVLDQRSGRFRNLRHLPDQEQSLAHDNVTALYQDPQGRLWAGTGKGVNQILPGADGNIRFRRYTGRDGMAAVKILAMRADHSGKLWMSTVSGLLRLDPDTGKVSRFTSADGLSEAFSVGVAHAAADGTLYFGGVKGMTGVTPALVRSASVPPQVAITDVSVFNRSLREGQAQAGISLSGPVTAPSELRIGLPNSVFSIEFAALHYTDPGRNAYVYRLDGFDRDWVATDAAHRSATYTNLDPGTYVFSVKAANHHGIWTDQATSMTVTILPPWWQHWGFRVLMAMAALVLLSLAYRLRVRHLTRYQWQLQEMVAARTRELEESNAKLAELSSTDALTGINNRRGFDEALDNEWRRAARNGYALALAMLDVDHFKSYNDHYGHQAGDQCLRLVAELIAQHARRTTDIVARYGGEEFALLAPATNGADALEIARGICEGLARLALPHAKSPYGVVTISIGVASVLPDEALTSDMLIQAADRAMYRAKSEGRNRARIG